MQKTYHILNGDALLERFPDSIHGERIVARECLIDGDVDGENLDEFFSNRASFLSQNYGETEQYYFEQVVPEFQRIQKIDSGAEINLWFEEDLFCQVNFWFMSYLIYDSAPEHENIFLVLPTPESRYSFAGLSNAELVQAHENRLKLTNLESVSKLWVYYQNGENEEMLELAHHLKEIFPFILPAVKAHIARVPTKDNPGHLIQSLKGIISELKTTEFAPVFREFWKREQIYGLGDLQVKRLFDQILNEKAEE